MAALRDEADIAVGNVVGSNIFNITAILGVTSAVQPLPVSRSILSAHLPAVFLLSLIFLPIARMDLKIKRWEGVLLFTTYIVLMTLLFLTGVVG